MIYGPERVRCGDVRLEYTMRDVFHERMNFAPMHIEVRLRSGEWVTVNEGECVPVEALRWPDPTRSEAE